MKDEDYQVGYGKPPKHSQFKKGKSGNPLGRPKKRKAIPDIIQSILNEDIMVNGEKKSKRELVLMSLVNDAIKGSSSDRKLLLSMMDGEEILEDFSPTVGQYCLAQI